MVSPLRSPAFLRAGTGCFRNRHHRPKGAQSAGVRYIPWPVHPFQHPLFHILPVGMGPAGQMTDVRKGVRTMHIEPGVVTGAKMLLSYGTGTAVLGQAARLAWSTMKTGGIASLLVRAAMSTAAVFTFFEIMPHYPVGVSEVHFIFGTTLYLLFGLAPAALGLAGGLLLQGLFFAPFDLPQYGINITTLLVPLFAVHYLARRIIPRDTAYVDLKYAQVLPLSAMFQAGIVSWVTFWALYGQGFTAQTLHDILKFDAAYLLVIMVEPVVDLAVLALAKFLHAWKDSGLFTRRLFAPLA